MLEGLEGDQSAPIDQVVPHRPTPSPHQTTLGRAFVVLTAPHSVQGDWAASAGKRPRRAMRCCEGSTAGHGPYRTGGLMSAV
ncbi:hypothetical protein GCM10023328_08260 [Modestobacter marinus]|uniref:Uncharacterized protein n=1 Tax=Modestobacter marinus TaxID=477641 RepID=A0ABQ2FS94_9ACTN|nr:hypothetical protein GCM10011589_01700 [Modestobacter marinus]